MKIITGPNVCRDQHKGPRVYYHKDNKKQQWSQSWRRFVHWIIIIIPATYSHRLKWEKQIWRGKKASRHRMMWKQQEMCSKHSLLWTSEDYWTRGMWKSGLSKSKGLRGGLGSFVALCKSLKSPVPIFMGIPIIMHSDTPAEPQEEWLTFSSSEIGNTHTMNVQNVAMVTILSIITISEASHVSNTQGTII